VLILVLSAAAISVNIYPLYNNLSETIRQASFQTSSIMTTTGYSTTDFNVWPTFSKALLLLLMFVGGCAGSTAGGLKVSRVMIIFKLIKRELNHLLHPREVTKVRMEGKALEEDTLNSVGSYFLLYMVILLVSFLSLSLLDSFDFETNFTAAVACFNNIGPGFGNIVGPAGSFALFSDGSKYVLSFLMLFGRLEIYPLLMMLSVSSWRKNRA
jgi:trk system potassium uptake protein TrkH